MQVSRYFLEDFGNDGRWRNKLGLKGTTELFPGCRSLDANDKEKVDLSLSKVISPIRIRIYPALWGIGDV